MFYGQCWKCGERWELGTASTCKCPDETPKREWVGLTEDEMETLYQLATYMDDTDHIHMLMMAEAKLKEKNHD